MSSTLRNPISQASSLKEIKRMQRADKEAKGIFPLFLLFSFLKKNNQMDISLKYRVKAHVFSSPRIAGSSVVGSARARGTWKGNGLQWASFCSFPHQHALHVILTDTISLYHWYLLINSLTFISMLERQRQTEIFHLLFHSQSYATALSKAKARSLELPPGLLCG